jgi:hypothetical protein
MALTAPWLSVEIRRSELGGDSALIGASELVFAEVIANPTSFTGHLPTPGSGEVVPVSKGVG